MSYSPTTWESGDTITSAKLNKLEQGVASAGVTIVHAVNGTLDMTAGALFEAAQVGLVILVQTEDGEAHSASPVTVSIGRAGYYVTGIDTPEFISATADGYPTASSE